MNAGPPADELSPIASTTLLERARQNDPAAWQRIVKLFGPAVYQWCARHGLQKQEIEDVVQEVFLAVAEALPRFQATQPNGFRAWLWTITANKIRDRFRRQRGHAVAAGGTDANERVKAAAIFEQSLDPQTPPPNWPGLVIQHASELIRSQINEKTWEAFWQTTVEGRNATEVARDLKMTPAAVRKAKSRTLLQLRQVLGER